MRFIDQLLETNTPDTVNKVNKYYRDTCNIMNLRHYHVPNVFENNMQPFILNVGQKIFLTQHDTLLCVLNYYKYI